MDGHFLLQGALLAQGPSLHLPIGVRILYHAATGGVSFLIDFLSNSGNQLGEVDHVIIPGLLIKKAA